MLKTIRMLALVASGTLADQPANAAEWSVMPEASRIAFSGTHAGRTFSGTFEQWSADIVFDPADLGSSRVTARVELASATTGDTTYDKTLSTADWFDTARWPTATFESTSFKETAPDRYEAAGTLDLRGVEVAVVLLFDLQIDGDTARLSGNTRLERLAFDIGKSTDAQGAWVALEIPVEFEIVARRRE